MLRSEFVENNRAMVKAALDDVLRNNPAYPAKRVEQLTGIRAAKLLAMARGELSIRAEELLSLMEVLPVEFANTCLALCNLIVDRIASNESGDHDALAEAAAAVAHERLRWRGVCHRAKAAMAPGILRLGRLCAGVMRRRATA